MSLDVPNLDNRRWADLVEEARALIPRLAPRWTDHNAHDPGITFIELFAWLAEMQIYQLNRVGERHREVFGRLAGVTRRGGVPARLNVIAAGTPLASVTLPAETQLTPIEGDEIIFETTTALVLTRSRLLRVVVDDGAGAVVDQTDANEKLGVPFLAFGEKAGRGAQLRLAFDRFYPNEEPTIRLAIDVLTTDLGAHCGPDLPVPADGAAGAGASPVDLVWEYLGPDAQWPALSVAADETNAFTRSGAVTLTLPPDAALQNDRVWIRSRIQRGRYDIEPRVRHIGVNILPCEQRETVRDELLGRGDGRPDQSFTLAKKAVLISDSRPPIDVDVNGESWTLVTSFDNAGPQSKQFSFDAVDGRVLFGNGLNGVVPMPGQEVRARWYRVSAGRSGKVAKDLAWRFKSSVVPGVTLKNTEPAAGGADPESLGDLELRARALLNRPWRAVTPNDIERLALGTPDVYVARAQALLSCPAPDQITVVVVPKVRPGRTGPPSPPSDALRTAVFSHLQERRLLGDSLRVVGPVYIEIRVSARLRLAKGAGSAAVVDRARRALDRFLFGDNPDSADVAAVSPCPTRWPFGRPVFPSEAYAVLRDVSGVDAVSRLTLQATRDGSPVGADDSGAIRVPRLGLVFAGRHDLSVESDARRNA